MCEMNYSYHCTVLGIIALRIFIGIFRAARREHSGTFGHMYRYIRSWNQGTFGYIRVHSGTVGYIRVLHAGAGVWFFMKETAVLQGEANGGGGTFGATTYPFYNIKRGNEGTAAGAGDSKHGVSETSSITL